MKKIIKSGTVGRATCACCECEFTFEREDIIFGNQFDSDNMVTCPCCGKRIVITSIVRPKEEDKNERTNNRDHQHTVS